MLLHGSFYRKLIILLKAEKEYGQRLKVLPNGEIVLQCTPVMGRKSRSTCEKMYRVRCHSIH
ncbi:uncharacterized protein CELE_R148.8 [Caenorhabditis elegans]|uniref:Uncharacterized protein n=1 Tax=Caenorhabditis elegans TaxID=6239 RepID=A0A679L8G9_CAEEL|nr:Uncharacterized protein CELE_R148.8 [Caenorhabditis elegans]CAA9991436.1 Uncharacterized protein CELE_R148.8 [Caenorhabditis elegans]